MYFIGKTRCKKYLKEAASNVSLVPSLLKSFPETYPATLLLPWLVLPACFCQTGTVPNPQFLCKHSTRNDSSALSGHRQGSGSTRSTSFSLLCLKAVYKLKNPKQTKTSKLVKMHVLPTKYFILLLSSLVFTRSNEALKFWT